MTPRSVATCRGCGMFLRTARHSEVSSTKRSDQKSARISSAGRGPSKGMQVFLVVLGKLAPSALRGSRDFGDRLDADQPPVHVLDLSVRLHEALGELLDADAGVPQLFLDDLDPGQTVQNLGDDAHDAIG